MKKEVIFEKHKKVAALMRVDRLFAIRAVIKGRIIRCTERKLLGVIPLPDRYKSETEVVEIYETKNGEEERNLDEEMLTYPSRRDLIEERLEYASWLRERCRWYEKNYKE